MDYWGSYYGTNEPSGGYATEVRAICDVTSFSASSADGAYSTVFEGERTRLAERPIFSSPLFKSRPLQYGI